MLRFRKLETEADLQEFCDSYGRSVSKRIGENYRTTLAGAMKKTKVVGVYQNGEMIGGYALSKVPHTALGLLTEENKNKMREMAPLESFCDLGSIWKKKGFSKFLFKNIVWPRIMLETLFFYPSKKNIIGYVATGHGRADAYFLAKPVYLQNSTVTGEVNVFVLDRKTLLLAFLAAFLVESFVKPFKRLIKKTHTPPESKQVFKQNLDFDFKEDSQRDKGRDRDRDRDVLPQEEGFKEDFSDLT